MTAALDASPRPLTTRWQAASGVDSGLTLKRRLAMGGGKDLLMALQLLSALRLEARESTEPRLFDQALQSTSADVKELLKSYNAPPVISPPATAP